MTERSVRVLTLNSGSSSLKAAVYDIGQVETRVLSMTAIRIGLLGSRVRFAGADGGVLLDGEQSLPNHARALQLLLGWLEQERPSLRLDVVGHRVVHGGGRHWDPELVTPDLLASLEVFVPVDPDHMPHALDGIRAVGSAYPGVRQVACFDTGFHRELLPVARRYAVPDDLGGKGIMRYGFHGLSYEYVMQALQQLEGDAAHGRVVVAHLGNGASMAAISDGRSLDTTMGFSPTGGLMMGTRCGDLDPSVPLYLIRQLGMSPDAVGALINHQSGLLGVSGRSEDMGDLLAQEASDHRAAAAVALFCYQAKKALGACAATLGGVDVLVFTGGIGEHAPPVRERIAAGLEFLGIELDLERNWRNEPVISTGESRVLVRVIQTNEELMVARHASRLAAGG
ncbi:MAG TPA: acetate/propionate family kinase [Gemmatimonadales bacterium]|nr:acetate/propionate family kinase [Gemmatimonadales bacterium]